MQSINAIFKTLSPSIHPPKADNEGTLREEVCVYPGESFTILTSWRNSKEKRIKMGKWLQLFSIDPIRAAVTGVVPGNKGDFILAGTQCFFTVVPLQLSRIRWEWPRKTAVTVVWKQKLKQKTSKTTHLCVRREIQIPTRPVIWVARQSRSGVLSLGVTWYCKKQIKACKHPQIPPKQAWTDSGGEKLPGRKKHWADADYGGQPSALTGWWK